MLADGLLLSNCKSTQINYMNKVSNSCAVWSIVVIAEDGDF